MRRFFLFFLLFLLSVPSLANEDNIPMPSLPAEPIYVKQGPVIRQHYVWLDNDTFRFTPYNNDGPTSSDPYEAYEYHLSSATLERLDWSPFYFLPDEEFASLIDFWEGDTSYNSYRRMVARSPYTQSAEEFALFVYSGTAYRECGIMCGYVMSYLGLAAPSEGNVYSESYIHPFTAPLLLVSQPMWAADGSFLVYGEGAEPESGCCWTSYSFIDLETNEVSQYFGGDSAWIPVNGPFNNGIYALSSEFAPRVLYGDWLENIHNRLILWTGSHLGSEECHCMLLPESKIFSLEAEQHFSGANFIEGDKDHFLAVAPDGLRLYEIETGEFTVLNPELNSQWIDLAVFSPDNQHMAVLVDENMYVLPTGYGE